MTSTGSQFRFADPDTAQAVLTQHLDRLDTLVDRQHMHPVKVRAMFGRPSESPRSPDWEFYGCVFRELVLPKCGRLLGGFLSENPSDPGLPSLGHWVFTGWLEEPADAEELLKEEDNEVEKSWELTKYLPIDKFQATTPIDRATCWPGNTQATGLGSRSTVRVYPKRHERRTLTDRMRYSGAKIGTWTGTASWRCRHTRHTSWNGYTTNVELYVSFVVDQIGVSMEEVLRVREDFEETD